MYKLVIRCRHHLLHHLDLLCSLLACLWLHTCKSIRACVLRKIERESAYFHGHGSDSICPSFLWKKISVALTHTALWHEDPSNLTHGCSCDALCFQFDWSSCFYSSSICQLKCPIHCRLLVATYACNNAALDALMPCIGITAKVVFSSRLKIVL